MTRSAALGSRRVGGGGDDDGSDIEEEEEEEPQDDEDWDAGGNAQGEVVHRVR